MVPLLHCGGWFARPRRCLPAAILLSLLLTLAISAQTDNGKDPVFSTVPFDEWVAQGDHVDIPWKMKISAAQLDEQQRFAVTVTITVDGKHLTKRDLGNSQARDAASSAGDELLMLMQIEDNQGRVYQGHASVPIGDVERDVHRTEFVYTHSALVTPGDYRFTLALLHRGSGDHDLGHGALHVAPLRSDPLPNLWEDTPPVEIIGKESGMEEWFHPGLTGHLHLPLATSRPVRIEVLVNLPKSRSASEYYRQCVSGLLAQMRVLAEMELRNGVLNITLLDAQHRRAVTLARHDRSLDWSELKAALEQANPNVINVRHLGTTGEEAEFLAAEVRRRLQRDDSGADERRSAPLPILIILSTPATIGRDAANKPASFDETHDGSVYLLRYHPPIKRMPPPGGGPISIAELDSIPDYDITGSQISGLPRFGRGTPTPKPPQGPISDEKTTSLQEILKSLKPRILDVETPLQFREALAAILEDLSRM
jgi:hypothetical protein